MATFLAIAGNMKVELKSFDCKTTIKLEVVEGKYLITHAEISPKIALTNTISDTEKVQRIADKAKVHCLVTNSLKTEITLTPSIS
jgi:organic hydroperoxide reductase OsmC/OhrA